MLIFSVDFVAEQKF